MNATDSHSVVPQDRPVKSRHLTLGDRARLWLAVQRYSYWLELRGSPGKERRLLIKELRANLDEAARERGVTQALFGIGSPKQLAYETQPLDPRRPRWNLAGMWAVTVFALVTYSMILCGIAFVEGVEASGAFGRRIEAQIFPWFGTTFMAQVEADRGGLLVGMSHPWPQLVLPLLTFILVAQPWRLLRRG